MPSAAREQELLGRMWERVAPLLPPHPPRPKGGRPFAGDRECPAGIGYVLRNGIRRNDLPRCYPSDTTCWRRQEAWTRAGVWDRVHRIVLEELAAAGALDTSELYADATFAEDREGGPARAAPAAASG